MEKRVEWRAVRLQGRTLYKTRGRGLVGRRAMYQYMTGHGTL